MTRLVAIGVGCRAGCADDAITRLVEQALAALPARYAACGMALYTIEDKRHEAGLVKAAEHLGLTLAFLSRDLLQAAMPGVATRSPAADVRFGVASVSEASALAGAGPGATLLVKRIAAEGATCAIAAPPEETP
ncbi:cobalamin biosynthesis protein [Lichenihabitans sp. PAMC28606]|uniref:cobalamin biosynthesis protein n=1 Tax=Lichenihabitans sp. PAMC28606 TaxID=2880932 RepID=UPI001D0B2850|nr:cobalamin biosynthesis protein [Lichenihabitans sp. PAMC28606]UDL94986.1 cobalamin biosynthesis protein [Lichenihabitans sp. PAMC28606]